MTVAEIPRHAVVEARVLSRQSFGLVIELEGNRKGYVDAADIGDTVVPPDAWPRSGESIPGVVLGTRHDGRVGVSARPTDVTLASTVKDPGSALKSWNRVRDQGFIDQADQESFFASFDARAALQWALGRGVGSRDCLRAHEVLAEASAPPVREGDDGLSENDAGLTEKGGADRDR